jgi:hypothetical protein
MLVKRLKLRIEYWGEYPDAQAGFAILHNNTLRGLQIPFQQYKTLLLSLQRAIFQQILANEDSDRRSDFYTRLIHT